MAAYAALLSITHTINQLENHPNPPISLHKHQVESLTQNVTFLQEFLETHNSHNDGLESRIADAAYAVEDIIESTILVNGVDGVYEEGLQKLIEDMDSIKKEVMELQWQMQRKSMPLASQRSSSSTQKNNGTTVGFDDVLLELMAKLVGGPLHRQVIPIMGMGGIGKTTLARNIFRNLTVVEHFDFLAWVTISQEYIMKEILLELLKEEKKKFMEMNEYELGDKLHKELYGKRYLIIMDDIWDIKIWEQLKFYFPDCSDGSRVVLTTRLSKLASHVSDSNGINLTFLNGNDSWNLFCNNVFEKEDCPLELEKIGRKIVESCRGLPLSINVIGGLLATSEQTQQHWEYIAENLSSVVNLEDNQHCLEILYTSYDSLPVYLKPCFLYMGVFREDSKISVSNLIRMWVAEGFLKPKFGKSLEDVGEEYLGELVDRNLILVEKRDCYGKLKSCKIHDLLRDLCLREARKHKFLCVLGVDSFSIPQDLNSERRIWTNESTNLEKHYNYVLESASIARSLIWKHEQPNLPKFGGRLLRLYAGDYYSHQNSLHQHLVEVFKRVNLRYINVGVGDLLSHDLSSEFPSSISFLWNLQTLVVVFPVGVNVVPFEIWKMPQLRHVEIRALQLHMPPTNDAFVLENLQTLLLVQNFKCSEEVVERIPNIKKLALDYSEVGEWRSHDYCLHNIGHLHELDSLSVDNYVSGLSPQMQRLTLPHSLKKLTLYGTGLKWEDMNKMVGSLPLLEGLKLRRDACTGREWITIEGQFCSLKYLEIFGCTDLKIWETDDSHFPRLEHIGLSGIRLKEVPLCIGYIDTLQSITVSDCFRSARDSARRIREEQEELGNEGLQVLIPSEDEEGDEDEDEDEDDCEDGDEKSNPDSLFQNDISSSDSPVRWLPRVFRDSFKFG